MMTSASTDTARSALARLVRAGDLPFAAMSADDRRRLVAGRFAIEDLRFAVYVSIAPRFASGLDVAGVTIPR